MALSYYRKGFIALYQSVTLNELARKPFPSRIVALALVMVVTTSSLSSSLPTPK
ncbi:MAG TPA: hypothetical protein VFW73_06525 [Lacipirellulaceae bacterium]|nr:hypothetical protein [Lacipirellulaceae bacterium]